MLCMYLLHGNVQKETDYLLLFSISFMTPVQSRKMNILFQSPPSSHFKGLFYHSYNYFYYFQGEAPIESFTMSVDRGYLGRTPGQERDSQIHRSMDDLTFQKTKGLELVRLLRVSTHLHRISVYPRISSIKLQLFHSYSSSKKIRCTTALSN